MAGQLWFNRTPPAHLSREAARYWFGSFVGYGIGFVAHIVFVGIFFYLELDVLAWFNVFSVALWAGALWANLTGRIITAYALAQSEVVVHAVLATAILGIDSGFLYYLLVTAGIHTVLPFYPYRLRLLLSGLALAGFVALIVAARGVEAPATVSEQWQFAFLVANGFTVGLVVAALLWAFNRATNTAELKLETAHARSEKLLRNILPAPIAERLKGQPQTIGERHEEATIVFADLVGFTEMSIRMDAGGLVNLLDSLFRKMDDLASELGIEKIKTIGDAYMAVAGLPEPQADHAERAAAFAIRARQVAAGLTDDQGQPLQLRIGLHSGPVVAGVIGKRKFTYDLWGDAVNMAARLEEAASPGEILVSTETVRRLGSGANTRAHTPVSLKGIGEAQTYLLDGPEKAPASAD